MDLEQLIAGIEDNRNAFFLETAAASGRETFSSEEIAWVFCKPSRWANAIYRTFFSEESIDDQIEKVVSGIRKGEIPATWQTGPFSRPQGLECRLEAHGFKKLWDAAGMAVNLEELNLEHPMPNSLLIEQVSDLETLRCWTELVTIHLFGGTSKDGEVFFELMDGLLGSEKVKFFLGRINGEPAATSALFMGCGLAGIYHVATRPEYRNQGIGRHITLAPLVVARDLGFDTAILQASEMGQPVYEKLGFKEYSRLTRFVYAP